MAGRPRKPTGMKVIEGTFRSDRANPDEPEYDEETPGCPPQLSPQAKSEWYRIVPLLEKVGLLAKVNRASLAAYCSLYARWIKAEAILAAEGEVVRIAVKQKGDEPYPKNKKTGELEFYTYEINPWTRISLNCAAEMRRYANEFGLTPASQSKVNATKKEGSGKKKNSAERFFKS